MTELPPGEMLKKHIYAETEEQEAQPGSFQEKNRERKENAAA